MKLRALSWSSLTTYESCPLRWKLRYLDGAPQEGEPHVRLTLGGALHSALEAYYSEGVRRGRPEGDSGAATRALTKATANLAPDDQKDANRVLATFKARETRRRTRVLAVEAPFRIELPNGVPFQGIVDRIDQAPEDRVSITDYKSSRAPPGPWLARRSAQLGYYQLGVEIGRGERVDHLAVEHLRTGLRFTSDPRTPKELEALVDRAGEAWDGMKAAAFEARPGRDCACEFARRCPYFSDLFPKVQDWTGEERARVAGLVERYATTRDRDARDGIEAYMREAGVLRAWGNAHVVERSVKGLLLVRERPEGPAFAPRGVGAGGVSSARQLADG